MTRSYGLALTAVIACQAEHTTPQPESKSANVPEERGEAAADRPPDGSAKEGPTESDSPAPADSDDLAKISNDVALPIPALMGKTPAEVEANLGEPLSKGRTRESCLRFTPERVWFGCDFVWQRYADRTETFAAVEVTYEDGISTAVAFEHLPGAGAFDPKQALAHVGLELPGTPSMQRPEPDVRVWRWFNDRARLVLDGHQYRVELSVRDDDWKNSKLEVVDNSPLTPEQTKKIKPVGTVDE